MTRWILGGLAVLATAAASSAADPDAVERGRKALLTRTYSPANITPEAFDSLWKQWGLAEKPKDYPRLLRERYGLHNAPYNNDDYPMGVRLATRPFTLGKKGLSVTCLVCHAGSIAGKSYVGLGNASLDYQAFYEETSAAGGYNKKSPFQFCNVRGTTEAGGMAVFLLGYRDPDLTVRLRSLDLDLHDDLCEDTPAWWLLKKKKTMYHTGGTPAQSVRSIMQFMMHPFNQRAVFDHAETEFRDIQAYLLSLEPPKYPLPIDRDLAAHGEKLFVANCSRCHGTYGEKWTYPNRIVPINEIGTDRRRYDGITKKFGDQYNKSWFAQEKKGWFSDSYKVQESAGYQAPPLDGIWATAPYFHNGSAPTVYHVLNSKARPRIFTRSYRTDLDAYDAVRLGWKIETFTEAPDLERKSPLEQRKIYDTSQPGRGNGGHTYGDRLSEAERMAVIEYLKTL
jgi:mono/diheme cytochrome c family protein